MNPKQAQAAPIVLWPSHGSPYSKTVRAFLLWHGVVYATVVAFLMLVALPLLYSLLGQAIGSHEFTWLFVIFGGVGFVLWLPYIAIHVVPKARLAPVVRSACEPWRAAWAAFENQSEAFRHSLIQDEAQAISPQSLALACVADRAPEMPPVRWHREAFAETPLGGISFQSAEAVQNEILATISTVHSYMIGELLKLGGRAVVGKGTCEGHPVVVGVFMVSPTVQFWTMLRVQSVGTTLVSTLRMGHQWWTVPHRTKKGTNYLGDIAILKRRKLGISLVPDAIWPIAIFQCMPIVNILAYPIGLSWFLWLLCKEVVYKDKRHQDLVSLAPECGDSVDIAVLGEERALRPIAGDPGIDEAATAALVVLRQNVLLAAQRASCLEGIF